MIKQDLLNLLNKKGLIHKKHLFQTVTLLKKMRVKMKIVF